MELSAWDVVNIGIKTVLYGATFCASGGVLFLLYSARLVLPDEDRRILRWVGWCVAGALVLSAARLLTVAESMADGEAGVFDGAMLRMVLEAGEARATGLRVVGLLLMGGGLLTARRRLPLATVGAIVACTSFAWIGHAWAAKTGGLSIAVLSLHLLGVAFWLGALIPLWVIAREGDLVRLAAVAARFGKVALVVVFGLFAAGLALLMILLGSLTELWTSDYGRTISLKLALVAGLISVAAFNKLNLTPRLLALDTNAALSLERSLRFEILVGSAILTTTATLTTLFGPRT